MLVKRRLIWILFLASVLRLTNLNSAPHFADMDWFFASANQALRTGQLPTLGITASITWLHQGPLWTYFLLLPQRLGINPSILTAGAGVAAVGLAYFASGVFGALVLAVLPFAVVQSQIAYHTSLIPLCFFVAYLSLIKRKEFISGLFLGFLYQLHLLTLIYWPLFLIMGGREKINYTKFGLGFALGILPFILAGPLQSGGIFIWFAKQLLTGFRGTESGLSTSYQVVLLPVSILLLGWMRYPLQSVVKWINANRSGFSEKRS